MYVNGFLEEKCMADRKFTFLCLPASLSLSLSLLANFFILHPDSQPAKNVSPSPLN